MENIGKRRPKVPSGIASQWAEESQPLSLCRLHWSTRRGHSAYTSRKLRSSSSGRPWQLGAKTDGLLKTSRPLRAQIPTWSAMACPCPDIGIPELAPFSSLREP